jgi:hypothetical protein
VIQLDGLIIVAKPDAQPQGPIDMAFSNTLNILTDRDESLYHLLSFSFCSINTESFLSNNVPLFSQDKNGKKPFLFYITVGETAQFLAVFLTPSSAKSTIPTQLSLLSSLSPAANVICLSAADRSAKLKNVMATLISCGAQYFLFDGRDSPNVKNKALIFDVLGVINMVPTFFYAPSAVAQSINGIKEKADIKTDIIRI